MTGRQQAAGDVHAALAALRAEYPGWYIWYQDGRWRARQDRAAGTLEELAAALRAAQPGNPT